MRTQYIGTARRHPPGRRSRALRAVPLRSRQVGSRRHSPRSYPYRR